MNFRIVSLVGFATLVTLCGCAHEGKPPASAPPAEVPVAETTVTSATTEPVPVTPTLSVDDELMKKCSLTVTNNAPKFAFDKSDLPPADRDILAEIGDCITTGPLAGRNVLLVGRADPRGTEEYNLALGERRANAVSTYLQNVGVDATRLRETSRGALDATGRDESGWAADRRVDVLLAR